MDRFVAIFSTPARVIDEYRRTATPEQMQAGMQEMMASMKKWMTAHAANIVEGPNSMGKTKRVTAKGASDARNDLLGYLVVQAESHEAAARLFEDHPHLQFIPEFQVEVMPIHRPHGM